MKHVPRITKPIVYKSICTMEEMSQRVSQSQVHTTDKQLPISAIVDPLVSTTIPQNTKKRPREVSDEFSDPAMIPSTPVEIDVEVKRSRLTNLTHVSQTPDFKTSLSTSQSHFSMQSLPRDKKTLGRSENRPRDKKGLGRSENRSYQDVSHVSESEKLSSDENINVLKTPFKKDNTVNSSDVIHISDDEVEDIAVTRNDYSEGTKHPRLNSSTTNTKRDVERMAVEKQKRTGVKHSGETEDKKSTMLHDVFGAVNVSLGEKEIKTTDVLRQQNDLQGSGVQEFDDIWTCTLKRPFNDSKKDEIIKDPDSEVRGKIKETTSPVISLNMKRCKISTDKSHVSDTERSFTETLNDKEPLMVSSEDELFGSSISSKNVTINNDMSKDVKKSFHDNEYQLISEKKGEEASDKVNNDFTGDGSGTDDICLSKSPSDSGWMCKKSFCIKEEEKGQGDNIANTTNAVDADSDIPIENCDDTDIKEEEYERDLISVEYTALVIVKVTHSAVDSLTNTPNTTVLKNVKKFRKQNINGNRYGLPEIIGGSDLVVFSSRNIDTEEWILQVQEMNEEDAQDKDADNLFRYNPTTSKKRHRR
ncbi:nibrin-like isoform X2 [Xenia sp. Carnegie-2017]|uniref:nibrin-like isoform X2 n=1 Tax=Xenia sp. Carnegie-2017 TaxID=2897299 RepID=UPI001F04496E|nr:nibrin-like isoform X2 [Xenia sp. Carnegie-2017]